jgi:hypothetical protein
MNRWAKFVLAYLGLALIAAGIPLEIFGAAPEQEAGDPHTEEALPSADLMERLPAQPPRRLPSRERLNHSLRRHAEATTHGGVRNYAAARSCFAR